MGSVLLAWCGQPGAGFFHTGASTAIVHHLEKWVGGPDRDHGTELDAPQPERLRRDSAQEPLWRAGRLFGCRLDHSRLWSRVGDAVVVPFHISYSLSRRQRLAVELLPWLPAIAGTIGFSVGVAYLVLSVSAWFLFLLLLPVVAYRGLFAFLADIAFQARKPVDVLVDHSRLDITIDRVQRSLSLDGIFQVCRSESGTTWTVLHLDRTVLTIPAEAITSEQLDFLKSFALRAAKERKAAEVDH
jgi:hypothetical protein